MKPISFDSARLVIRSPALQALVVASTSTNLFQSEL
jgi:hypothetical protein